MVRPDASRQELIRHTQVASANGRVVPQLGPWAASEHATFRQKDRLVADGERVVDAVVGDEHGASARRMTTQ